MLQESRDLQDESRLENLEELINSAREYSEQNPQATLADWRDSLTPDVRPRQVRVAEGRRSDDAACGERLEFRVVVVVGMEEGIFPHARSIERTDDLEEERRLCYLGMTRAREMLFCMHAHEWRVHGLSVSNRPSAA